MSEKGYFDVPLKENKRWIPQHLSVLDNLPSSAFFTVVTFCMYLASHFSHSVHIYKTLSTPQSSQRHVVQILINNSIMRCSCKVSDKSSRFHNSIKNPFFKWTIKDVGLF